MNYKQHVNFNVLLYLQVYPSYRLDFTIIIFSLFFCTLNRFFFQFLIINNIFIFYLVKYIFNIILYQKEFKRDVRNFLIVCIYSCTIIHTATPNYIHYTLAIFSRLLHREILLLVRIVPRPR